MIGRLHIRFIVSYLSCFSANSRQDLLTFDLHMVGYLWIFLNCRIIIDSNLIRTDDKFRNENFDPDFLDDYNDAKEDLEPNLPEPFEKNVGNYNVS